jgi:hypothetical protein
MFKYTMQTIIWSLIGIAVGALIYWIADWKKQHPNGD